MVVQQARWWDAYGGPSDPRKVLNNWQYQAHLAILEGRDLARQDENDRLKDEARKAK